MNDDYRDLLCSMKERFALSFADLPYSKQPTMPLLLP